MLKLKQLNNNFIPSGGIYSSHAWYISLAGVIEKVLRTRDGRREVQDFVYLPAFTVPDAQYIQDLTSEVKEHIDMLFTINDESYARIYRALTEEYNPIWNVDGTEVLESQRDNTGKQDIDDTHSGSLTTTDTLSNTTTSSATAYNSAAWNDTNKVVSTNGPGDVKEEDTRKIERDRTDDLHEHYKETKTRGGNIGVTKSQELIEAEMNVRMNYKFIEIVERDILKEICYSC